MPKYEYTGVWAGRHGTMICCRCNKPITTGQYRVKETPDKFVLWHKECCPDDPEWLRIELIKMEHEKYLKAYEQACREFVAKWGIPDEGDFDRFA